MGRGGGGGGGGGFSPMHVLVVCFLPENGGTVAPGVAAQLCKASSTLRLPFHCSQVLPCRPVTGGRYRAVLCCAGRVRHCARGYVLLCG